MPEKILSDCPTPQKRIKPYHEMSFEEYAATEHSEAVPRWSILAVLPESYTRNQLCQLGREVLLALAFLWGVKREGSKEQLADRILARVRFRLMLGQETQGSLASRRRKDLVMIAKEAGIYHSWLSREHLASALIRWREEARRHAKLEIATLQHERLVTTAAQKGLPVPADNLTRYGLDASGQKEPTVLGVPLSRAMRTAPEALTAAKTLPLSDFRDWVQANGDLASKLVFIEPGILGDGGDVLWIAVRKAFTPPELPPLFAGSLDPYA